MKFILTVLLILFVVYKAESQISESWFGIWSGELFVLSSPEGENINTVHMELHISPADSAGIFKWRMIYRDSASDDRKYLLRAVNEKAGKYEIDEQNGIIINASFYGNKLLARFVVDGSIADITFQLDEEKIVFEVIAGGDTPVRTATGSEENINVGSFNISNYQRAFLYKKN